MRIQSDLLHPLCSSASVPGVFPSPFSNGVCDLASDAARSLQSRLPQLLNGIHDFECPDGGKMMGVLVVKTATNKLAYFSGFSGMLGQRWQCAGFVPPAFDFDQRTVFLGQGEATLAKLTDAINSIDEDVAYQVAVQEYAALRDKSSLALAESNLTNLHRRKARSIRRSQTPIDSQAEASLIVESREDKRKHRQLKQYWSVQLAVIKEQVDHFVTRREALIEERRRLSHHLQLKVFDGYLIKAFSGEVQSLRRLFGERVPPGGAGDCAAVKLLSYCFDQQLTPLCMAEFWWGATPSSGIRHHGSFYPPCRGRCGVILPVMLQGIATGQTTHEVLQVFADDQPAVVFEDKTLIVVNKPAGMLSVPGKISVDSVENRLRSQHPQASNALMLVHRLDQATSGLLVAAKNAAAHKHIQQQFQQRLIEKRYCAILSGVIHDEAGTISLPLRVDIDDRPRQLVCYQHGKSAVTHFRVIQKNTDTTRVEFKPVTGRTHQLRLHAAHHQGLNAAIVGDELYGKVADRLHLHAEALAFIHPVSGRRVEFTQTSPF